MYGGVVLIIEYVASGKRSIIKPTKLRIKNSIARAINSFRKIRERRYPFLYLIVAPVILSHVMPFSCKWKKKKEQ